MSRQTIPTHLSPDLGADDDVWYDRLMWSGTDSRQRVMKRKRARTPSGDSDSGSHQEMIEHELKSPRNEENLHVTILDDDGQTTAWVLMPGIKDGIQPSVPAQLSTNSRDLVSGIKDGIQPSIPGQQSINYRDLVPGIKDGIQPSIPAQQSINYRDLVPGIIDGIQPSIPAQQSINYRDLVPGIKDGIQPSIPPQQSTNFWDLVPGIKDGIQPSVPAQQSTNCRLYRSNRTIDIGQRSEQHFFMNHEPVVANLSSRNAAAQQVLMDVDVAEEVESMVFQNDMDMEEG